VYVSDIWLPGAGRVPAHIRTAQQAVEAYDSRLELGFNERNGDWVVLWKDGPDGAPFPVLGLGKELPSYERIQYLLWKGDTVRRGGEVVQDVIRRNEARKKEGQDQLRENAGEVAEVLEHAFRRMGKTSYNRIFVPKGLVTP
jgi:hypothetical protein